MSILTYTNPQVTKTMQSNTNVVTSLGVSASIHNTYVASHIIYPTTLPHIRITFTFSSNTYKPLSYSPSSPNAKNDPLIIQLLQTISSLQNKVSNINQNQNGQPTYYVKKNPLSLEILITTMSQGIEVPRFDKYGGKGYPTNHFSTFTTLCCDFILEENILAKIFPKSLKNELLEAFINHFQVHMTPKMSLDNLMRCEKKDDENIIDFI